MGRPEEQPQAGALAADALASPASTAEALAAVRAGLEFLAGVDAAALSSAEQAECLRELAAADSARLAAACRVLSAFNTGGGYLDDGQQSTTAWLRWQTRVTPAAAAAAGAWMRRLAKHSRVAAALAAGSVSASFAREICDWTERLPEDDQPGGDAILLGAAVGGASLGDLAALAEEMFRRRARPDTDGGDESFARRRLRLTRHYLGHGLLEGDLTPPAADALRKVLDCLGRKTGPEDERTAQQRDHDALEEALRRLIAAGDLPERAGQPVQIQLNMTLSQLLGQAEAEPALAAWLAANGAAAPPGADCDATIVPVVTGAVDDKLAAELVARLLAEASGSAAASTSDGAGSDDAAADSGDGSDTAGMAERAARMILISQAIRLLSGPSGLAAWLRTGTLTGPVAGLSLPLDIGTATETIPAHIRRAVARRDRHCRFPGCDRQAAACQVHHLRPRSQGGETSVGNCCLLCAFHHLIAIHQWGWTLTLNADGTTTAVHPQGWRTLHSHPRPAAA
jgi:Domain of unknown function (DUF222)/HNH endonuclease